MEKGINFKTEELRAGLFELINKSKLPISSIYYVFKDFMQELTDSYNKIMANEYNKYQEELKKENEQLDNNNDKDE